MSRYELDQLGFYQFEWLVQVLVKNEYGFAVEAWGGHSDHGRDAYSHKNIQSVTRGVSYPGPIVFQAKFVSGANAAGAKPLPALLAACRHEKKRIEERITKGQWAQLQSYFLYTNAPIEISTRKAIKNLLARRVRPTLHQPHKRRGNSSYQ
jgi:hypothetical protein